VKGSTVITQDTPVTCKNSVFGFCRLAILLGISIPQSLGLRKTAFFSVAPTDRSRSGYSLSLFGESCPDDDSRQSQNPEKLQNVRRKQNHGKAKER
jgi:hypothetical protein